MYVRFWTSDVEAAMKYYETKLGFDVEFSMPDIGVKSFAILKLEGEQVMFGLTPEELVELDRPDKPLLQTVLSRMGKPGPASVYLAVAEVESHYHAVASSGVEVLESLWETPWGLSQYSVRDLDGNLLTFHN